MTDKIQTAGKTTTTQQLNLNKLWMNGVSNPGVAVFRCVKKIIAKCGINL